MRVGIDPGDNQAITRGNAVICSARSTDNTERFHHASLGTHEIVWVVRRGRRPHAGARRDCHRRARVGRQPGGVPGDEQRTRRTDDRHDRDGRGQLPPRPGRPRGGARRPPAEAHEPARPLCGRGHRGPRRVRRQRHRSDRPQAVGHDEVGVGDLPAHHGTRRRGRARRPRGRRLARGRRSRPRVRPARQGRPRLERLQRQAGRPGAVVGPLDLQQGADDRDRPGPGRCRTRRGPRLLHRPRHHRWRAPDAAGRRGHRRGRPRPGRPELQQRRDRRHRPCVRAHDHLPAGPRRLGRPHCRGRPDGRDRAQVRP